MKVNGWKYAIIILTLFGNFSHQLPDVIRIGALFDKGDVKQEVAFRYAIEKVNSVRSTSRRVVRSRYEPMIEKIPPHDSFYASKRVCYLMRSGVAAIFGPQSSKTSAHIQSICDAMELPHVETRWDYKMKRDDYSVNLFPHPSSLSKAFLDLVLFFNWKSVCILYEKNEALIKIEDIMKEPSPYFVSKSIKQLPDGEDYRHILRQAKIEGEMNIVLDCSTEKIVQVLKQAQQIGMMTPYNNFVLTSLDSHFLDLEDFKYGGSNITAFRLLDSNNWSITRTMNEIQQATFRFTQFQTDIIGTEAALIYDAVQLFAKSIEVLDNSTDVTIPPLSCDGEEAWIHGNSLINYMKMSNTSGLTGVVEFDAHGFRTNFVLDIIELRKPGFVKVGTWSKNRGMNYTQTFHELQNKTLEGLKNRTLTVSFAFNDPYIMLKESADKLTGNDRYEGFCIDLIDEIAKNLHFNYTLTPVPGNAYGSRNPETGEWNGMIRELLEQRADMAITDFSINSEREEAVDFTMPFMNLGVTILYKKPRKMAPSLFSFMSPLSLEVWMYTMAAYVGISLLLYILARFTPYEWVNPHPCEPEPDTLENQFTLHNCLWFGIGSLMQQGCDILPQAWSTRMVAGSWWFFTLIIVSSYTANLAAFLTVERMESPIESVEDLAAQTKIKYGSMETGTTTAFFRDSNLPTYKKMWAFMTSQTPSPFVATNAEGYLRVQESNGLYAFLSESTSIEYVVERRCDLTQVGGLLDSKSYGIALPPGSPNKDELDVAILNLQERGRMYLLKEKWWRQKRGGGRCKEESSASGMASELNLSNVGGVFVVLLCGLGLALLAALCEFLLQVWDNANEEEVPFMEILLEELRFIFKCRGNVKPVKKKTEKKDENDEEKREIPLDDHNTNEENSIYNSSNIYNINEVSTSPT